MKYIFILMLLFSNVVLADLLQGPGDKYRSIMGDRLACIQRVGQDKCLVIGGVKVICYGKNKIEDCKGIDADIPDLLLYAREMEGRDFKSEHFQQAEDLIIAMTTEKENISGKKYLSEQELVKHYPMISIGVIDAIQDFQIKHGIVMLSGDDIENFMSINGSHNIDGESLHYLLRINAMLITGMLCPRKGYNVDYNLPECGDLEIYLNGGDTLPWWLMTRL